MKPEHISPEAAEQAFYEAFARADLEAMMSVWDTSDDIVCIHPLGPRLQGQATVRQSWQQIFNAESALQFKVSALHSIAEHDLVVRLVYEHITVRNAAEQPTQPIIATNIYRNGPQGWRMVLHHASPGPAQSSERVSLH
jgi:ketosteroid isomerase-like protein